MIFHEPLLAKVLGGEKMVTRRTVKFDQVMPPGAPGPVAVERQCKYQVGRTYAVQPVIAAGPGKGRGGPEIARILIKAVDRCRVQPTTIGMRALEARREGFGDWFDFKDYWIGLYGSYDPNQIVDRIEFELAR